MTAKVLRNLFGTSHFPVGLLNLSVRTIGRVMGGWNHEASK